MNNTFKAGYELFEKFLRKGEQNYSGEQLKFNCPNCAKENDGIIDNKFNLEINLENKKYHCWKCGIAGNDLKYLIRFYGRNKKYIEEYTDIFMFEAYDKFFLKKTNTKRQYESILTLPAEFIPFNSNEFNPQNTRHAEAYNYLVNDRKISHSDIVKYNIGFCLEGNYENRIVLPSYDKNNNINFYVTRAFVDGIEKYLNPPVPKNDIILNERYLSFNDTIYIVEGYFDYLSFPLNTLVLLEKRFNDKVLKQLMKYEPNLVFLLDPDAYNDIQTNIDLLEIRGYDLNKIKYVLFENVDIDKYRANYGEDYLKTYIIKNIKSNNDLRSFERIEKKYTKFYKNV